MAKFKCKVCGYVHEGDKAPEKCPVCQAPASEFEEMVEEGAPKKKGLDTNSNAYTIIYAAVMVVIVAFLLAFVSSSLKDKQEANVKLDYKKQILNSLDLRGLSNEEAEAKYNEVVKEEQTVENGYSIYTCELNGETKYILTVHGMGLWNTISGFIALNADKETVYGVFFNHEGETAGLGAEIKDSKAWQDLFKGKKLYKDGIDGIALGVKKKVENPENEVDAVTGATLTSDGVDLMLKDGLKKYNDFLKK
ncbi:MAG: Na(+)-translocating NADH:ubiquinone reductase subunit C [Bacteroidaceae bacterium]|nr:Na(+)-translocating NADH:ubiquinone reductase subunit C [Bacteroidaceae bacterium]